MGSKWTLAFWDGSQTFLVRESFLEKVNKTKNKQKNQKGCLRGILGAAGSQLWPPGKSFCSS